MHRIDTATAEPDLFGAGKDGFRDGTAPGVGSTRLDAAFFNALQEEPATVVESSGLVLVKGDHGQLLAALEAREILAALGCGRVVTPGSGTADLSQVTMALVPSYGPLVVAAGVDGSDVYTVTSANGGITWVVPASGMPAIGADGVRCVGLSSATDDFIIGRAAGKWVHARAGSTAAANSGTTGSGGAFNQIIWDAVNSRWWAATDGGLYHSTATPPSWTLVSASNNFKSVCVLPSGRVIAYRSTDDKLYYSASPFSSATAGVTLSSSGTLGGILHPVSTALGVVAVDSAQKYFRSVDGTALAASVSSFFALGSFAGVTRVRSRLLARGLGLVYLQGAPTDTAAANLLSSHALSPYASNIVGTGMGFVAPNDTPNETIWVSGLLLRP